jgi:hypothetical protein
MRIPLLVVALLAGGVAQAEPLLRVTTDSIAYCDHLATRLNVFPTASQEPARSLAEDGMRLCGNGHVRTGIAKLRRALRVAQGLPG